MSAVRSSLSPIARGFLIVAGVISVGLGFAGVFVPLLPTTPFLLLAAACFVRSSETFYTWLTTNRFVGNYVRNYMEHRATTLTTKVTSISMLWVTIGITGVFFTDLWWVRALLLVIAVGVTLHLASLRTLRSKPQGAMSDPDRVRDGSTS